jgi:hypothetical protein
MMSRVMRRWVLAWNGEACLCVSLLMRWHRERFLCFDHAWRRHLCFDTGALALGVDVGIGVAAAVLMHFLTILVFTSGFEAEEDCTPEAERRISKEESVHLLLLYHTHPS